MNPRRLDFIIFYLTYSLETFSKTTKKFALLKKMNKLVGMYTPDEPKKIYEDFCAIIQNQEVQVDMIKEWWDQQFSYYQTRGHDSVIVCLEILIHCLNEKNTDRLAERWKLSIK